MGTRISGEPRRSIQWAGEYLQERCKNCGTAAVGWSTLCRECAFKKSLERVGTESERRPDESPTKVRYMMIQEEMQNSCDLALTRAAELVGVSRSGYYKHVSQSGPGLAALHQDEMIRSEMHAIAREYARYGYRRMTIELKNRGFEVNHKKVLRVMREEKLVCAKKPRYCPVTTNSNHSLPVYPNLTKEFDPTGPDQVWVSDITYVPLNDRFVYLAVILDQFTKRCVGWELSRNVDAQLTLDALKRAIHTRKGKDLTGLIHHSDRGVQYAATCYTDFLKKHGISISMSRKGNPYENAYAESFIKTVKYEEVYLNEYRDFRDVYGNLASYIDGVYNSKRLHSSIGYKSPIEFEREVNLNAIS